MEVPPFDPFRNSGYFTESGLWRGEVNAWEKLAYDDAVKERYPVNTKGRRLMDPFHTFGGLLGEMPGLTLEIKEEMVNDAAIAPAIEMTINSITSRGWQITGGDQKIRDYLQGMVERLNPNRVFKEVLSAYWIGHNVCEVAYGQEREGENIGKYFIREWRPLPAKSIDFKTNAKGDIEYVVQDGATLGMPGKEIKFFPGRFKVFTYNGGLTSDYGDPRGHSILERCYPDYWSKVMIRRMKDQHLELGAGAILVGNAGEMSVNEMLAKVADLRSGSATVLRLGQTLEFVQPSGDGEIYLDNLAYHDKRMREALLAQLFFGSDGQVTSGKLSQASFELFARVRIQDGQRDLAQWVQDQLDDIVNTNWGFQDEYPKFEFLLATEEELAQRAERDMRLAKMGLWGTNDMSRLRNRHEMRDDDPGDLLPGIAAEHQGTTTPGGVDDSTGDHEMKANDENFEQEAISDREDKGVEER